VPDGLTLNSAGGLDPASKGESRMENIMASSGCDPTEPCLALAGAEGLEPPTA
jgi:hypothetical protein